jgi:hypothetical protein|tara:strand:+ start:828 stop:1022 length:195 start_codon:yes stop_codon:yes gene_type:complete
MRVEKISYDINWRAFKRGSSFFIPCLQCRKAKKTILTTTNRLKYKVVTKVVIEEGVRGLRVWRV